MEENIEFQHEFEDGDPPPPGLISSFDTLQDWLINICDSEQPEKSIATYNFGLFESAGDYTIFLIGENTYDKEQNYSVTSIDFKPLHMYFPLPKSEYENLIREQLVEQLTDELRGFTKTDKFKNSFLAKANSIKTDFSGEIWSR